MRAGNVGSAELYEPGLRLNGGFFLAEDEQTIRQLRAWSGKSTALCELCVSAGVISGPIFRKIPADGPSQGTGYISAKSIFQARIQPAEYLSPRLGQVLDRLILIEGSILVTCSGMNLGRCVWVRSDMAGLAGSGDLIRIFPDSSKAPPGYIFAFLSSRFGHASIRKLIYGGHIRHVSPTEIAKIQVPRLSDLVRNRAHGLVIEAAELRASAACELAAVGAEFDRSVGAIDWAAPFPRVSSVNASDVLSRFDAQFHDPVVGKIRQHIMANSHITIGKWCSRVFLPGIFKRIHADDLKFGSLYFTGAELFSVEPRAKGILSRKSRLFDDVVMRKGNVLVQAFGQDGGVTGRATWVGEHLDGATTTHMLVRLIADSIEDSAYLYGFLQSESAYSQVAVLTYGGSIPHFDEAGISTVVMPILENRDAISIRVLAAVKARDRALAAEIEARKLVESAIEEGVI